MLFTQHRQNIRQDPLKIIRLCPAKSPCKIIPQAAIQTVHMGVIYITANIRSPFLCQGRNSQLRTSLPNCAIPIENGEKQHFTLMKADLLRIGMEQVEYLYTILIA